MNEIDKEKENAIQEKNHYLQQCAQIIDKMTELQTLWENKTKRLFKIVWDRKKIHPSSKNHASSRGADHGIQK